MEASYDGPVIEGGVVGDDGKVRNHIPVSIDELVLCEDCLKVGARLLGMEDADAQTIEKLRQSNTELREVILGLQDHNTKLEAALVSKPKPRQKATA